MSMNRDFDIITTINTQNIRKEKMLDFIKAGATIFRINSSFLTKDTIEYEIVQIRDLVGDSVKILIDLPGYKIRFLHLEETIDFQQGDSIKLKPKYFNYPDFLDILEEGAVMRINNGFNLLKVIGKRSDGVVCEADSDGSIKRGKGIHLDGLTYRQSANCLSPYDLEIINVVKEHDVDYAGLSFVHDVNDIKYVEELLGSSNIKCIPKIESKESMQNLEDILEYSELAIIDRGDLAGEIGIERIWNAQKKIISLSKAFNAKIIIATQILTSMENNPLPTIAEVSSLSEIIHLGISGIQLSEETSTGKYETESICFINRMVDRLLAEQKI